MKYYVYQLVDPRTGDPFYVGKGKGRRAWAHAEAVRSGRSTGNAIKEKHIADIHAAGLEVRVVIVEMFEDERAAYARERELIASVDGLTNAAPGGGRSTRPPHLISIEYAQIEQGMREYKGKDRAYEHLRRLSAYWEKWERLGVVWEFSGTDGERVSREYHADVRFVIQARDHLDGKDVPFPELTFDLAEVVDKMLAQSQGTIS